MNYLAHLLLSGNDKDIIVGNFIGDAIKGKDLSSYQIGIQQGITMHRHIDTFADSHPVFRNTKRIFAPEFDKYSGVLVDVFYDHFLAKNFESHHHLSLNNFSKNIHKVLKDSAHHLPYHSSHFLEYMQKYDILNAYATLSGITQVLSGLTRRINGRVDLTNGIVTLEENYSIIESHFEEFFNEAAPHFNKWLNQPVH